jgi:hypothetical protein
MWRKAEKRAVSGLFGLFSAVSTLFFNAFGAATLPRRWRSAST